MLRVRQGDHVAVLDGEGHEFRCEVLSVARPLVRLKVMRTESATAPICRTTLLQAIPKGKLFEFIIQKATELGAFRIVPLLTERVVTHLDEKHGSHKAEKWRQVAIEAIKQCGALWLPQIELPVTPAQFLARQEPIELTLMAALQGETCHPRRCFEDFHTARGRMPSSAALWIGPEGDFTPSETELILTSGAIPITLGPQVLRTETAALYCLSVMQYEFRAAR